MDTFFHFHLLLFRSLMCPPGSRICPFFSQVSWGSGSPCAWQVKIAVVPTGRAMDCGGWTNSAGAEKEGKPIHQICCYGHQNKVRMRGSIMTACRVSRSLSFLNKKCGALSWIQHSGENPRFRVETRDAYGWESQIKLKQSRMRFICFKTASQSEAVYSFIISCLSPLQAYSSGSLVAITYSSEAVLVKERVLYLNYSVITATSAGVLIPWSASSFEQTDREVLHYLFCTHYCPSGSQW